MNKTQFSVVLEHLQTHGSITSMQAFIYYGITRLSAIVFNLRKAGYPIITNSITSKNRYGNFVTYAEYTLKE